MFNQSLLRSILIGQLQLFFITNQMPLKCDFFKTLLQNMKNPFKGLLLGESLIEELSFIDYYHFTQGNQFLHIFSNAMLSFWLIIFTMRVEIALGINLAHIVMSMYTIFYLTLDPLVGIGWGLLFALYYPLAMYFFIYIWTAQWWATFLVMMLILMMQFMGHIIFEKKFPAFRAFEAFVTTPCNFHYFKKVFCMFLMISYSTGYKKKFLDEVTEKSSKWKGSEECSWDK